MPIKTKRGYRVKGTKVVKKTKKGALKVAKKLGIRY